MRDRFGLYFEGGMGAAAIQKRLETFDLEAEAESLRDTIANARRHDAATAAALGTALAEFIPHLRPDASSGPAVLARFRSITESPSGGLPHLYLEAFVRAFLAASEPGGTPH